jgi:hypothetical protein
MIIFLTAEELCFPKFGSRRIFVGGLGRFRKKKNAQQLLQDMFAEEDGRSGGLRA